MTCESEALRYFRNGDDDSGFRSRKASLKAGDGSVRYEVGVNKMEKERVQQRLCVFSSHQRSRHPRVLCVALQCNLAQTHIRGQFV